jgi:predicted DNA-binding ribbon-helix-helix protein
MSDIKHSVRIAGHRTSITLEAEFWDALKNITREDGVSLNALIARIDAERLPATANLSRAVRLYVLKHYRKASLRDAP